MRKVQSPIKSSNYVYQPPVPAKRSSHQPQITNSNSNTQLKYFKSEQNLPAVETLPLKAKHSFKQNLDYLTRAKSFQKTNSVSSPRAQPRQQQRTQQKAYTYENQDTYIGEWQQDQRENKQKPNGYGCYKFKTQQLQYRGYFVNGFFQGTGTLHRLVARGKPELIYEGEWFNGQKHGHGKYYYAENTFYQGNWVRNKKQGKGIFVSLQGEYNGQWMNDMKHGKGVMKLKNGYVYDGEWEDDTLTAGEIKYPNGDIYVGQINEQFQPHLSGDYTFANGEQKYKGTWRNGKKQGQGEIIYPINGQRYNGGMKGDKREGQNCTYEWKNGVRAVCSFENNFPVRGRMYLENGSQFQFDLSQIR